jgi:hypothetical protein
VVVASYVNRDRIRLKIASVYASVPPKAAQPGPPEHGNTRDVSIVAPWALSALPECLRQTFEATGSHAYVAAHLPAGYELQPSGTVLSYSDCIITTRGKDVLVRRGKDRFSVSPPSELFRKGSSIALIHDAGARSVLRIYQPAPPSL